jgi:hypothetical protein
VSPSIKRLLRYGALAALCIVVVGGAVYLFDRSGTATPATAVDNANPPGAANRRAAAKPAANPDDQELPSAARTDQVLRLVGDARRLAGDGKFAEATAALDQADKVIPGLPETAQARREIAQISTPQGQLATQLSRARAAIEQDDRAAAEKALAEAERLSPQAPEIAQLRQTLQAAQQKQAHRSSRIAELLKTMREAIARHDFSAADGALNEAARIDVRDPAIDEARVELARAHDAERKANAEK